MSRNKNSGFDKQPTKPRFVVSVGFSGVVSVFRFMAVRKFQRAKIKGKVSCACDVSI